MSQRYIGGLIYNPPGGYSGYFDGTSDWLSIADNAALELGSGDFTLEAFVNFNALPAANGNQATFFSKWTTNNASYIFYLYNSSGTLKLYFTYSTNGTNTTDLGAINWTPAVGTWNHIACVRSGTNLYFFVNGFLQGSATINATLYDGTAALLIGNFNSGTESMNGYMSNVRLVKGTAVYTAAFTPPVGPLQAITNTSLLTCAYPTFRDGSTNNFTITVNGNTAVSVQNPFPLTALPNPALGGAGNGVYTISQYQALRAQNLWPAFDPYWANTTLMLHGNGTNGAQNNTFLDSSTNNFTITRNGNTTQGTFSPYGSNWSNYFDGTGDYLSVPSNAAFSFGTGDFTIEAWVFVVGGTTRTIIDTRSADVLGPYILDIDSNNKLDFLYANGGRVTSSATAALNQWNHVAVTRSGSTIRLFINGVLDANTSTYASSIDAATNPWVGAGRADGSGNPGYYMNGYISNLRILKGTAQYTASFTPQTGPLTAITNTSILTCQSNRFIDNSSNNFTITRNGDVSVQRFSPFSQNAPYSSSVIGGSGYFDGTGDYLTVPSNANLAFGTGDFTVEMFAYFNALPGGTNYANLFDMRDGNFNQVGLSVYVYGTTLGFDSGATVVNRTFTLTTGQWYHIVWSRVGTTYYTFVNGVQQGTGTLSTNYSTSYKTYVGSYDGTQSFFNGYLSSIRVLKGTGVSSVTVPTAPLTAVTNTQLLLNFTNGGIIDNAMMNDLETVGNAQVSTTQSKFGGASMYFDGTGDWLLVPHTADQLFGTGNFTIECWLYLGATGAARGVVGKGAATTGWLLSTDSSNKVVFTYGSSTITSSAALAGSTWYHIAVVREGTGTNQTKIYIGGTNDGTGTVSTDFTQTNAMYVGANRTGGDALNGYIDDFRITKGVARYTTNFTPQTSQWQDQ